MSFFEAISEHWHVIITLAGAICAALLLYLAAKFVRHEKCEEHRKEMEKAQTEALSAVPNNGTVSEIKAVVATLEKGQKDMELAQEKALANLPTKDALNELKVQMTGLEGSINTLEAKLEGYNRALENMERLARSMDTYLREHGVKK